jgi:hypothetical protein
MTAAQTETVCRVLLALGVLLASGCEKVTQKITEKAVEAAVESAMEKQTGGSIDIHDQGVTLKSADGKGVLETMTGKVPDDWPREIPTYPGAKVNMSMMTGKDGMLMLETTDAPDAILAFYKAKLGMKQQSEVNMESTRIVTFEDEANRRTLAVSAGPQDGKTFVNLQLFEKKPQ